MTIVPRIHAEPLEDVRTMFEYSKIHQHTIVYVRHIVMENIVKTLLMIVLQTHAVPAVDVLYNNELW